MVPKWFQALEISCLQTNEKQEISGRGTGVWVWWVRCVVGSEVCGYVWVWRWSVECRGDQGVVVVRCGVLIEIVLPF